MGVRGFGSSREEAFEQAAVALTAVMTEIEKVTPVTKVEIACEASDDELLFADWLNAIIFEMATRGMLFSKFQVKIQDHKLRGVIWGEKVDVAKHQPAVEVKGATYTQLKVAKEAEGQWVAQCVVDV